jgi:hypothetical protein
MNERTKEQSVEQEVTPGFVTPGCELDLILAACAAESNGMDETEGGGIEREGAIRTPSIRIRAEAAAKPRKRTTSRKKTTVRIKSTGNCQPLKKTAGRASASDDETPTAGANIRIVEAELSPRAWLLAGNKSSELEGSQSRELQWRTILRWMTGAWKFTRRQLASRQSRKRLRVCESVSLGEKRFVAVIEVDGEQFLVGGASSSVATLARLEPTQEFSEVLKRRWAQDPLRV